MTGTAPGPLIYQLAGSPPLAEAQEGHFVGTHDVCAVCGCHQGKTAPLARIAGKNFTDQFWLADLSSDRICLACGWMMTGKPPRTLRMWTVIAAPGRSLPASNPKAWLQDTPGLMLTSRGHTQPVIDILTEPPEGPWLVSIAVSGQKHVLPFSRVNHGRGAWQVRMETATIVADPGEFRSIIGHAASLRAAGHSADAVLALTPGPFKTREQLDQWMRHATHLTALRGAPVLELALWALTKETINDVAAW